MRELLPWRVACCCCFFFFFVRVSWFLSIHPAILCCLPHYHLATFLPHFFYVSGAESKINQQLHAYRAWDLRPHKSQRPQDCARQTCPLWPHRFIRRPHHNYLASSLLFLFYVTLRRKDLFLKKEAEFYVFMIIKYLWSFTLKFIKILIIIIQKTKRLDSFSGKMIFHMQISCLLLGIVWVKP